MYRKCLFLFLVYSILAVTPVFATTEVKVPEPLKPWVDWVLHDQEEELLCTPNYNNSDRFRCNWPAALDLDIKNGKGSFSQNWSLEHESWIQLPGNEKIWPEQVTINAKPAVILKRRGVPQVKLPPGNYQMQWNGVDQSGNQVGTGVYFCRLQAGSYSQTIKMVYLR